MAQEWSIGIRKASPDRILAKITIIMTIMISSMNRDGIWEDRPSNIKELSAPADFLPAP